jgi:hypothetical protein
MDILVRNQYWLGKKIGGRAVQIQIEEAKV